MIEQFLACALALNDVGCTDPATAEPLRCGYRYEGGDDAIEAACLERMRSIVRREDDDLILSLDQGSRRLESRRSACDSDDAVTCLIYRIDGYLPRSRLYVVEAGLYEGTQYRVVSRRTGADLLLEARPLASPGETYIAVCLGDEMNGSAYGVEIYRTGADLPRLEFRHLVPADAYALFVCDSWVSASELQIMLTTDLSPPVEGTRNIGTRSHRLRLIDGVWRWDGEPRYVERSGN